MSDWLKKMVADLGRQIARNKKLAIKELGEEAVRFLRAERQQDGRYLIQLNLHSYVTLAQAKAIAAILRK